MGRLEGKVALITGAAQGLGAACGRVMAAHGAKVVLGDIRDEAGEAVAREIGEAAVYVRLDVTSAKDWAAAVDTARVRFGRLDALVNNAAIGHMAAADETLFEDWIRVLDVNLNGAWRGVTACLPALKAGDGGAIINISSIDGIVGSPYIHAYVASKFALRGISKSLAAELAPFKIRVNSVHPGLILTPMSIDAGLEAKHLDIPLKRGAEPEEIAQMVVYLASDESRYVTGSELLIDGGLISHLSLTGLEV